MVHGPINVYTVPGFPPGFPPSNVFKAIAYEADLTLNSSADLYPELTRLKEKLALEIENANAAVPQRQIDKARVLVANGNDA